MVKLKLHDFLVKLCLPQTVYISLTRLNRKEHANVTLKSNKVHTLKPTLCQADSL